MIDPFSFALGFVITSVLLILWKLRRGEREICYCADRYTDRENCKLHYPNH